MERKRGFIIPFLTIIFNFLRSISPLTLVTRICRVFRESWEVSYLAVEIYVVAWFSLLLLFAWLFSRIECLPLFIFILAVSIWRLSDISQSWFNIFFYQEPEVLSPVRSLVLATINYFELAIVFGLLAFFFREEFNPAIVTITESLRYSIGVITTMGSRFDPASWVTGLIYYLEIAFGLAFLVVVISRVISLFRQR